MADGTYKAQDFTAALSWYAEATLYAASDNYWPHLGLGNAYYAMGNREKAYEAYGSVLEKEPRQVTARLYRAKIAMAKPGPEGPIAQLGTLEVLAREHPQNLEVLLSLAEVYETKGDSSGAISVYEKALALHPDNGELLLAVGTQWQKLGHYEQAKKAYLRAASINPNVPVLHYNLGIVHNELNELEESAAAYRKAIELDPNFADSRYGLAVTYEKQQKYRDALETYQTYVDNPGAKYQREAAERIELLKQSMNPQPPQPQAVGAPVNQSAVQPPAQSSTGQ
jgi:tetratricopeptide (TPR) repeat protein